MADETPMESIVELQRRTFEQSQTALEQSIEFQRQLNEAIKSGIGGHSDAHKRSLEVTQMAFDRYLDTIANSVPGSEQSVEQLREVIDDQLQAVEDAGDDVAALTADGIDEAGELSEAYIESLSEQLELLEQTNTEMQEATLEFLEETEAQLEELQDSSGTQMREQVEQLRDQISDMQDAMGLQ